jgi:GxxExxY protein
MQNSNGSSESKLLHPELTEKIIGVYYDVYNEVGHGFLESVYTNCMCVALGAVGLSVRREVPIPVYFRGVDVGQFKADLVVEGCILAELKAVQNLD